MSRFIYQNGQKTVMTKTLLTKMISPLGSSIKGLFYKFTDKKIKKDDRYQ